MSKKKSPTKVIAKLFRDIGQTAQGLTPAVEDAASRIMRRKARDEGNRGTIFAKPTSSQNRTHREYSKLRESRLASILHLIAAGPVARRLVHAHLQIHDGSHFIALMRELEDQGLAELLIRRPRSVLKITDAGRAWVLANPVQKVAAE